MNKKLDKNTKGRKQLYVFCIIPFLVLPCFFLFYYRKPFRVVFPEQTQFQHKIKVSGYDDRSLKGNSWVQLKEVSPAKVSYRYTLKDGFTFPYVGILFASEDSVFFDLSSYDYLTINIRASKGSRVPLSIMTEIPGYSSPSVDLSFRNSQYVLTVSDQENEIQVPLNEFKTPDWWYTDNYKTVNVFGEIDFSSVRTIQLGNCINIKKEKEDIIEITALYFHKSLHSFYLISGFFLLIYVGIGLIFFRKRKVEKTPVNFQYEKTETVNHLEKEEEMVFGFITSHYSDPELTIIDVQSSVGIHERKISAIIKKKTELNFKQFLNSLRISEAKRLLAESDLQISEIAFKVGYGNASHFNRVFKSSEGCSPNDFRKQHTSSDL